MAVDISKQGAKGGDPQYDTSQLRGVREERGIVTGIVKANVHGAHMGVIKIWVPTFSTNPDDRSQWRTVRYCTPFYSRVDNQGIGDTYRDTKVTSGIVTPPPDLGTKVLAFFPEGRNAEGYYFACVPDTFMLQSVPEASVSNGQASGEFNDVPNNSKQITNWKKQPRPVDYFTQDQLVRSGLSADTVRGLSTSSYMRESPSELIGISSKGRRVTKDGQDFTVTYNADIKDPNTTNKEILNGLLGPSYRRKGHSVTLDDGDIDGNSNQIRLRTSTGHQILLNDTTGVIYVGNADGTAWIELCNSGTMDVYAQDSINFRSKNIQFHADDNIKFHSKGYTQIVSEEQMHVEGKKQLVLTSKGEAGITGEKGLHLKSNSELFATSSGASYINSGGIMSVNGSLILLQGPKTQAKTAKNVNELQKEDTTFDPASGQYILDEEQQVTTTADRIVTHEPFPYHCVKNITSAYTGGLVGGGGGFGGAFSIVGGLAGPLAAGIPSGLDGGLAAAVANAGGSVLGSGVISGIDGGLVAAVSNQLGGLNLQSVTSQFANITSNLPLPEIQSQFSAVADQFAGADFGKLITDSQGKITGLTDALQQNLPNLQAGITEAIPVLEDTLPQVLNSPALKEFPVTDLIKQTNNGFSIGALDSFDVQGLNAAVVKQVGSFNNPAFVDSVTKSVGKFGFNVQQLKDQGFVRPEAIFNDQLADSSVWTGKEGVSSLNKLLANSGIQEQIQQGVVAGDYQKMFNTGAIKLEDSKKEIMSMLTASNVSSPEIAAKLRQGATDLTASINTTNISDLTNMKQQLEDALQSGAAASQRVDQLKSDRQQLQSDSAVTRSTSSNDQINTVIQQLDLGKDTLSPAQVQQLKNQLISLWSAQDIK